MQGCLRSFKLRSSIKQLNHLWTLNVIRFEDTKKNMKWKRGKTFAVKDIQV